MEYVNPKKTWLIEKDECMYLEEENGAFELQRSSRCPDREI